MPDHHCSQTLLHNPIRPSFERAARDAEVPIARACELPDVHHRDADYFFNQADKVWSALIP
jgi:hypothetical protein